MFCCIEKNACSQMSRLMNDLNGLPSDELPFGSSAMDHFHWTQEQLEAALKSDDWYKAIFLRSPLERLASAFASNCAGNTSAVKESGKSCIFYEEQVAAGVSPPFPDFVATLASGLTMERGSRGRSYDAHFVRQTDFCGGINVSDYDFVGTFDQDLNHQIKQFLRAAGASEKESSVDKYFMTGGSFGSAVISRSNQSWVHTFSPAVFKQFYTSVDTILNARRLYENDFRALDAVMGTHQSAKMCITTIFALDFEKRRILDWISYHNLMGVDCFLLFHDHERSDVSDMEVREVYDQMANSSLVTILQAQTLTDRTMKPEVMHQWFQYFGTRYLIPIDVDEFIVLDKSIASSSTAGVSGGRKVQHSVEQVAPPDLFAFLEEDLMLTDLNAAGAYMHRWDYGTNGFKYPPSLALSPEFVVLQERWGTASRASPEKALGKMILNLGSGVEYTDVHHWQFTEGGGAMLFPNGTEMCKAGAVCEPETPRTPQPLSLNHYATGSLTECYGKASSSKFSRRGRDTCERMHPGTTSFSELEETQGIVVDPVLVKYADATRKHRQQLFPDLSSR